jgi:hypothetical protein
MEVAIFVKTMQEKTEEKNGHVAIIHWTSNYLGASVCRWGLLPPHYPFLNLTHVQKVQRRHLNLFDLSRYFIHGFNPVTEKPVAKGPKLDWFLTYASLDDLYCYGSSKGHEVPPALWGVAQLRAIVNYSWWKYICTQPYIISQIKTDEPGRRSSQPMQALWY